MYAALYRTRRRPARAPGGPARRGARDPGRGAARPRRTGPSSSWEMGSGPSRRSSARSWRARLPGAGRPPRPLGGHGRRAGRLGPRPRGGRPTRRASCPCTCAPRKRSSRVSDGRVPDVRIEPMRSRRSRGGARDRARVLPDAVVAAGVPPRAGAEPGGRALGGARRAIRRGRRAGAGRGLPLPVGGRRRGPRDEPRRRPGMARRGDRPAPARHPAGCTIARAGPAARSWRCGPATPRRAASTRGSASRRWVGAGATTSIRARMRSLLEARLDEGPFAAGAQAESPTYGTRPRVDAF